MAEALSQVMNHWEAKTGAAIMANMVFVDNAPVHARW